MNRTHARMSDELITIAAFTTGRVVMEALSKDHYAVDFDQGKD
jgi:hypothetical protein